MLNFIISPGEGRRYTGVESACFFFKKIFFFFFFKNQNYNAGIFLNREVDFHILETFIATNPHLLCTILT